MSAFQIDELFSPEDSPLRSVRNRNYTNSIREQFLNNDEIDELFYDQTSSFRNNYFLNYLNNNNDNNTNANISSFHSASVSNNQRSTQTNPVVVDPSRFPAPTDSSQLVSIRGKNITVDSLTFPARTTTTTTTTATTTTTTTAAAEVKLSDDDDDDDSTLTTTSNTDDLLSCPEFLESSSSESGHSNTGISKTISISTSTVSEIQNTIINSNFDMPKVTSTTVDIINSFYEPQRVQKGGRVLKSKDFLPVVNTALAHTPMRNLYTSFEKNKTIVKKPCFENVVVLSRKNLLPLVRHQLNRDEKRVN